MGINLWRALLHWAACYAEAEPLRLLAFCVRACRSLGGIRRSSGGLRSLTLLRCLSGTVRLCFVLCLTLQVMAPKAYLIERLIDLERSCISAMLYSMLQYVCLRWQHVFDVLDPKQKTDTPVDCRLFVGNRTEWQSNIRQGGWNQHVGDG